MKRLDYLKQLTKKLTSVLLLVGFSGAVVANSQSIDSQTKIDTINRIIEKLEKNYVNPESAKRVSAKLTHFIKSNELQQSDNIDAFTKQLNQLLYSETKDKHLQIAYEPQKAELTQQQKEQEAQHELEMWKAHNFGVTKVERLKFNIGYLNISGFAPTQAVGPFYASAMNLLANTDSLIIDLRDNFGGHEHSVTLLASYFLDKRTHLNDMYNRSTDKTEQNWSHSFVSGSHYGESRPLYILVNENSFSAAEDFSYTLKHLGRATIVGENTGGGANSGDFVRLNDQFTMFLPTGRSINPFTKTNWEGVGVEPHIAIESEKALVKAQTEILNKIKLNEKNTGRIKRIDARINALNSSI
ncbi:S41 family peptidase [Aliikangiella sp. IMCC44632]